MTFRASIFGRLHRALLVMPILALGITLISCEENSSITPEPLDGSWILAPRISTGELTASQLDAATWVRVEVRRFGGLLAQAEAAYNDGAIRLIIPSPGDVDFLIIGYSDSLTREIVWTGSGVIRSGQSEPGLNAVVLQVAPPVTRGTINYGGLTYRTVTIGRQTWMAENLRYAGLDGLTGSCSESELDTNCTKGRLYTFAEALNHATFANPGRSIQGICPSGWHIPTEADWKALISTVEADNRVGIGNGGIALRSVHFWGPQLSGTDLFGFRVLPLGIFLQNFNNGLAGFWSSSDANADGIPEAKAFRSDYAFVDHLNYSPDFKFSVRCMEDIDSTSGSYNP